MKICCKHALQYTLYDFLNFNSIHCFYSVRLNRTKVMGFWEDLSCELEDDEFRRFYRMNKQTLRALTGFLKPVTRVYQGGREQVSPSKMVAITVAFLGSQMPCKQMSSMFGMSEGCFLKVTEYVMQLLTDKSHLIIKWPNKDYPEIAAEFNKRRIRLTIIYFKLDKQLYSQQCNS